MCGIAAIVDAGGSLGPQALEDQLTAMLETIRHRGDPGRFGERWIGDGVALGTNRLAIVDRERGRQPQSDVAGEVRIVFNGEIYAYRELRRDLVARGHAFRTETDTEVLVAAYREWGAGMVDRLDGMFAFVLHDSRTGTFLAARDHIGIKPLYYVRHGHRFHFASEQKALLGHDGEIMQVMPGTYLANGETTTYFRLAYAPHDLTDAEAVATYRRIFEDAVRKQVDTDLPVAVMFSGGIDSGALISTAVRYNPSVVAFSVGSPGAPDVEIARRYCAETGIPHHVAYLDDDELIRTIPEMVYGTEFFESINVIESGVSYFLFKLARDHGFKVALTGEGSDEVLAGYDLFKTHEDPLALMRYRVHNLYQADLQRVDRASMMNTVEARVPYLDRRLLEFAYSVPMHLKIRGGVEKWILREAFRDRLPSYIAERPKARMPDGAGLRGTLVRHARQHVDLDPRIVDDLGIDAPEGVFFLKRYLEAGYPLPARRTKLPGLDYSHEGSFIR